MKEGQDKKDTDNQLWMDWKKSYIETLIDALRPFGDVLEVGFGRGEAARRIQTHHPKSHTIIESDPQRAKEAQTWAKGQQGITVIHDTWQNALAQLGQFDAVFFNDYRLDSEAEMIAHANPEVLKVAEDKTKEFLNVLKTELSHLTMRYSDEEIEDFYQKKGQFNAKELSQFFSGLKQNKHITPEQYERFLQKYQVEKEESKETSSESQKPPDLTFVFLQACLKSHMRKGSRFSCFSTNTVSKYEDAQFFEHIITNANLNYQEKLVAIQVPSSEKKDALVMVVEKTD